MKQNHCNQPQCSSGAHRGWKAEKNQLTASLARGEWNWLSDNQSIHFFPHLFPRSTKHGRWEKSTFPASLIQAWHLETSLHSSCCTMIPTGGWFLNRLLSIFAFLPPPRLCSVRVHSSMRSAQSSRIIKSVQTPLQLLAFEERQLEVVFWFANSWMQQLI